MKSILSVLLASTFLCAGCCTNPIVKAATAVADKETDAIQIDPDLLKPCVKPLPSIQGKLPSDLRENYRLLLDDYVACASRSDGQSAVLQGAFKIGPDGKPIKK